MFKTRHAVTQKTQSPKKH